MKKQIGGFFEIELIDPSLDPSGITALERWTKNRSFGLFTTVRSIILELKNELKSSRLWIPEIFCNVLQDVRGVHTYVLQKNGFDPDIQFLNENLQEGDIVLVVNFFGTEVSTEFIEFVKGRTSIHWVEDACHSLQPLASWSDFTIYSPRKLFGVAEGGVIVQNKISAKQINFSDWRVERNKNTDPISPFLRLAFPDYPELHAAYVTDELNLDYKLRRMSDFAQWQLKYLTIDEKIEKRRENFSYLKEEFEELLPTGLNFNEETIPFGFPIYINARDEVQKRLFQQGIFAPIHWRNQQPIKTPRQSRHEALCLTIPCDHRYDTSDMHYVKTSLKSFLKN